MIHRRDGFTLLEILVATGLTAFLLTAGLQMFQQIMTALERSRTDNRRDLAARILLDRLERELLGTILVVKEPDEDRLGFPWLFVAEDRVFGTNDSDGIKFITQNPARPPSAVATGPRMVSYALEPGEGDRLDLYRREEAIPEGMEKEVRVFDGQLVLDDLNAFRLRFFDEGTGEWRDSWDSTDIAMLDQLPGSVELTVQLVEEIEPGKFEAGAEHQRIVRLLVRPFVRTREEVEPESECEDGPSVSECLAQYAEEITALSADEREALESLSGPLAAACWNATEPTQNQELLRETFASALGLDPDTACP